MNFQQLETFLWIAKLRSFSLAAKKLNATQSTVSTRLAELEKELDIRLFERSRRSVRLTPKGRDLLRYADEILFLHSEVKRHVGNPKTLSGTVRIGAAELIALTWLPDLIRAITDNYPRVGVELQIGLGGELMDHLDTGELDIALTPIAGKPPTGVKTKNIGTVQFGFVGGPQLQLPKQTLRREEIQRCSVITHGQGSVLCDIVQSWLEAGGSNLARTLTSSSMEVASKLAEAGLGITFLPLFYYRQSIESGRLQALRTSPAIAPVRFIAAYPHDRDAPLTDSIVELSLKCSTFKSSTRNQRTEQCPDS